MKIILLGNIGVGKSSLANLIIRKYSFAEIISIDNIRNSYGDSSMEKELFCKEKFIDLVKTDNSFQIIELSGIGILGEKLFAKLNNITCPILVVYLYASLDSIQERIKDRKWETPIPFTADKVIDAIYATQNAYSNGLLNSLTNQCKSVICISLNNEQHFFDRNYNLITNIIELLDYGINFISE